MHSFETTKWAIVRHRDDVQNCHGKSSVQQEEEFYDQQIRLKCKEKTSKVLNLSTEVYDVKTWTLRKLNQKYLENVWCWRMLKKISGADREKSEAVLQRVKKNRIIVHAIKLR